MKSFKYTALRNSGKKISGTIEANSEFDAAEKIKAMHATVVTLEEKTTSGMNLNIDLNEPMSIDEKQLSLTASQFAILLKAGLPAARTIQLVADQTSDKYLKKILSEAAKDVNAGFGLAQSLQAKTSKLPATFIETIRAGEESATLETSFEKLAAYYDKSAKLHAKVKSALTYPAFLAILAVVVIAIVVNVTIPTVAGMIADNGGELPWPTQFLLGMYDFFKAKWYIVLGIIAAIVIAFKAYKSTPDGKMNCAKLGMKIPILGNVNLLNAASQFASTMTTLLNSGLPITRSMMITSNVVDNYAFGTSLKKAVSGLEEGRSLGDVLSYNEYLPPLLIEMASVGDEAGSLEETLTTIGRYYDSEVEQATAKALGMLEPLITIIMGICIGFIILALYLPMFTMYSGM